MPLGEGTRGRWICVLVVALGAVGCDQDEPPAGDPDEIEDLERYCRRLKPGQSWSPGHAEREHFRAERDRRSGTRDRFVIREGPAHCDIEVDSTEATLVGARFQSR